MNAPISPFGKLLWETAKSCEGRSAVTLDRVLTAKVRIWLEEQSRLPEPIIAPAEPF